MALTHQVGMQRDPHHQRLFDALAQHLVDWSMIMSKSRPSICRPMIIDVVQLLRIGTDQSWRRCAWQKATVSRRAPS
ncbi:MAG: hypothetical protein R3E68_21510 [Burkholderiaceae bacterium]